MELANLLGYLSLYLGLIANVVVALCTLQAWLLTRHRFLLVISISAAVGICSYLLTLTWGNYLETMSSEWLIYSSMSYALGLADVMLYTFGVVQATIFIAGGTPTPVARESESESDSWPTEN